MAHKRNHTNEGDVMEPKLKKSTEETIHKLQEQLYQMKETKLLQKELQDKLMSQEQQLLKILPDKPSQIVGEGTKTADELVQDPNEARVLIQIYRKIPLATKEKIWSFQYVDFAELIPELTKPHDLLITLYQKGSGVEIQQKKTKKDV